MTRSWRKRGLAVVAFDINYGEHFDLTMRQVYAELRKWIREGRARNIAIASPCNSHSRARRAPAWSRFPRKLRSDKAPYGISGLSAADQQVCDQGNLLSQRASKIIEECVRCGVAGVEENPRGSYLWQQFARPKLLVRPENTVVDLDQCAFGARHRKSTRLFFFGTGTIQRGELRCAAKGKLCAFTGRRHIALRGTDAQGDRDTKSAARYPPRLSEWIVARLEDVSGRAGLSRLWQAAMA